MKNTRDYGKFHPRFGFQAGGPVDADQPQLSTPPPEMPSEWRQPFVPGSKSFVPGSKSFVPGSKSFVPGSKSFVPGSRSFRPA
jgi:hypothetical protein